MAPDTRIADSTLEVPRLCRVTGALDAAEGVIMALQAGDQLASVDEVQASSPSGIPSRWLRAAIASALSRRSWLPFLLTCVVVFGLRWHTVNQVVINWDESLIFVIAQDLVEGGTMYRTTWEHKGPMLFLPFVPVVAVAGPSIPALRLYTTFLLLVTMLMVELIARRLFRPERAFVAPMIYGTFFCVPHFGGLASGAELVMMVPVSLAILLAVVGHTSKRDGLLYFLSGVVLALSGLVKASALYSGAAILLVLLFEQLREAQTPSRRPLARLGWFAAGGAASLGLIVTVFALKGLLGDFLFANLWFNARHYVQTVPQGELGAWLPAFLGWAATGDLFTVLALASGLLLLWKCRAKELRTWSATLVIALVVTSFFGFTLGRRMLFHYYLQMALPFALLICWAVTRLRLGATDASRVAVVGLVLAVASAFAGHRDRAGVRSRDPQGDKTLTSVVAQVRASSGPRDSIYVLGGEPVIYFLAERKAPTRYFWWVFCTDTYDAGLASQREVVAAFTRKPPRLFVYKRSEPRVPALEQFMFANYVPIATVDDYQIALHTGAPRTPSES